MKFDSNFYRELVRRPLCGHPCYRLFTAIQLWILAKVTFLIIGNFKLKGVDRMHTVIICLLNPKLWAG
jgi:hypothetical protein